MDNKQHQQPITSKQISEDIQGELDDAFKIKGNTDENECYTTGETNTINFIKADGQQQMFPYSQLITAWTEDTDEENIIKIFFATHLVTIKGHNLKVIYEILTNQNVISMVAIDKRYFNISNEEKVFINEITIEWKRKN
jgi:hypothetical protein